MADDPQEQPPADAGANAGAVAAPAGRPASPAAASDELRDQLPDDLDVSGFVGPYRFPDNSRRRIPGVIYLVVAAGCLAVWLARRGGDPVLVNEGYLWTAILLGAVGAYSITSGWRMQVDEKEALVRATQAIGFAVGHASAQQSWRGLRSRPTWRILCYSSENPPRQRALVLVDAVDGEVVAKLVEDNPEDWAPDDRASEARAPEDSASEGRTPEGRTPEAGTPEAGTPEPDASTAGPT